MIWNEKPFFNKLSNSYVVNILKLKYNFCCCSFSKTFQIASFNFISKHSSLSSTKNCNNKATTENRSENKYFSFFEKKSEDWLTRLRSAVRNVALLSHWHSVYVVCCNLTLIPFKFGKTVNGFILQIHYTGSKTITRPLPIGIQYY